MSIHEAISNLDFQEMSDLEGDMVTGAIVILQIEEIETGDLSHMIVPSTTLGAFAQRGLLWTAMQKHRFAAGIEG